LKRREFITLLGGAAAWPLATWAQQPTPPIVGFLHTGSAATRPHLVSAFRDGLEETGYVEGRNVAVEYRWADDQKDRLPALVADLVARQVTVIAASGEPAVFAARTAASKIPVIFLLGDDPAKLGLVASLARPGGNMTGVNLLSIELQVKRLGVLNELITEGPTFAHFIDPSFPLAEAMKAEVEAAAKALRREIRVLKTTSKSDIDAAFATIVQEPVGGLLVGAGPFFNSNRHQIIALAAQTKTPAIYEFRDSAVAGGLMSYGTSLANAHRILGLYAGRILRGDKPSEMPVQQSVKVEMVINLKTANSLGLTFPITLLGRADEVIE
jgi:putative ABC transport system substrate-binding protein